MYFKTTPGHSSVFIYSFIGDMLQVGEIHLPGAVDNEL
jgi:hypothetical protein